MNEPSHSLRFVRSLALGLAAGVVSVAACTSAQSDTGTTTTATTTTTEPSSGNEQTADAGAGAATQASVVSGAPCAPGSPEVATTDRSLPSGTTCICRSDGDAGATTGAYVCMTAMVGPLSPPELSA